MSGQLKLGGTTIVRYEVCYYDWWWEEIVDRRQTFLNAHQMITALEDWNTKQQQFNRSGDVVVPLELPHHVSIGVEYVEV